MKNFDELVFVKKQGRKDAEREKRKALRSEYSRPKDGGGFRFRQDNDSRRESAKDLILAENPLPARRVAVELANQVSDRPAFDTRNQVFKLITKSVPGGYDEYGHEMPPVETTLFDYARGFKSFHVRSYNGDMEVGKGTLVPFPRVGEVFWTQIGMAGDTSRFHHSCAKNLGITNFFVDGFIGKEPYMFHPETKIYIPYKIMKVDGNEKIVGFDLSDKKILR